MNGENILKAAKYIRQNYKNIRSLEDISNDVGLNHNSLREAFAREMGMTLSSFLNKVRCRKACEFLKKTNSKLYAIALDVGFKSDKYFIKVFEKFEGISPEKYRKRIKNNG